MRKFALISMLAAAMVITTPAFADDTSTAVSAAAGAAVGTVATAMVKGPDGASLNCNALDISQMSDQDIINVRRACDSVKAAAPEQPALSPDNVREWAGLAKEFGSAIGQTAKELGIAVNDFLRTPAGILITIYLFWSKLGGIVIGIPFVITIWFAFFKVWNTYRRTPKAFETKPVLFGLMNKKYVTEYQYRDADEIWWSGALGGLVTAGISALIICTIIL